MIVEITVVGDSGLRFLCQWFPETKTSPVRAKCGRCRRGVVAWYTRADHFFRSKPKCPACRATVHIRVLDFCQGCGLRDL